MFRVWSGTVGDVPPMQLNCAMTFGAPDLGRFRRNSFRNGNTFPVANLLAMPDERPLHFTSVDSICHYT
jgi:hypothetical protein